MSEATTHPIPPASPAIPDSRSARSPASWIRFLIPAALGLTADLAIKAWSFPDGVLPPLADPEIYQPQGRHPVHLDPSPIIPNFLSFVTTVNHGAVFGFGQGRVSLFLAFSFVALAIIIWIFLTSWKSQRLVHIALGLITAGALGNIFDRAAFQGVRDMLKFNVTWYPYIFNVADVLLCIGVPLLILRWLLGSDGPQKPKLAQNSAPAAR